MDNIDNQANVRDTCRINTPLKVATFNCRGLLNRNKRRALFLKFQKESFDFVSLQETHILNINILNEIKTQWSGPMHISPGTGRGKGLITLFNKKYLDNEVEEVFKTDRILASSFSLDSEKILIINIYAPCENADKSMFFDSLSTVLDTNLKELLQGHIILLGDLNISKEPVDVISGLQHSDTIRRSLNTFINKLSLVDAWRIVNPEEKSFTWCKSCRRPPVGWCNSARRLDYIFVSESLVPCIKSSLIHNFGFSDHRAVVLNLEFSSFKFGRGLFKLNAELLKDINYCKIITNEINDTLHAYRHLNPQLVWEMVKLNIKEVSQQYGKYKARERRLLENDTHSKLLQLEKEMAANPCDENLWLLRDELKKQLELHDINKAKGAQVRSRMKYCEQGERNTSFFS